MTGRACIRPRRGTRHCEGGRLAGRVIRARATGPLIKHGRNRQNLAVRKFEQVFTQSLRTSDYHRPASRSAGSPGALSGQVPRCARSRGGKAAGHVRSTASGSHDEHGTQSLGEPQVRTLLLPRQQILRKVAPRHLLASGVGPAERLPPSRRAEVSLVFQLFSPCGMEGLTRKGRNGVMALIGFKTFSQCP